MRSLRVLIPILLFLAAPSLLFAQHPLSGEVRVSADTQELQQVPRVAANPSGEFVVVWAVTHPEANERSLRAVRFNADGTPATGELLIAEQNLQTPLSFAVTMMDDGSFAMVLPKPAATGVDLVARWYAPNGDQDGDDVLVTQDASPFFSISTQGDGGLVAVWQELSQGVKARVFKASRAAGSEILIDPAGLAPAVSVGPQGAFVVAWLNGDVVGRRFTPQGTAASRRFVVAKGEVFLPLRIAKDDGGNFLIFYGGPSSAMGQRYKADTTPIGGPLKLQATANFDVAVGGQGNFVLVWEVPVPGTQASRSNAFVRRFKSDGTPLGPQLRVNERMQGFQSFPRVAIGADGGFVVVWQRTLTASISDIFARRYGQK
ncbi:MAG TPA: hypothetical protein VGG20_04295 [Thermoanaerobaculia bacterium]|jgi:hypothetical protein